MKNAKSRPKGGLKRFANGLALAGFEPALGLVNHIDPALAAHHTAIAVAALERTKRVLDLHGLSPQARRAVTP
jgi:hypothetical protein